MSSLGGFLYTPRMIKGHPEYELRWYDFLALASDNCTYEEAKTMFLFVDRFFPDSSKWPYSNLKNAVWENILFNKAKFKKDEFYYQGLFRKLYPIMYPGGQIIEKSTDRHNIPDVWVEYKNNKMPVEVKLKNFDKKALDQLQRYMFTFNAKNGIAVAKKLTVYLPEYIEFISIDRLEETAKLLYSDSDGDDGDDAA